MKTICYIKGIWRSIQVGWPFSYPVAGHDYVEQKNGDLICEVCGHIIN